MNDPNNQVKLAKALKQSLVLAKEILVLEEDIDLEANRMAEDKIVTKGEFKRLLRVALDKEEEVRKAKEKLDTVEEDAALVEVLSKVNTDV